MPLLSEFSLPPRKGVASRGLALKAAAVFAFALLLAAGPARADSRAQRPLQLQLGLYGVSVGYHFSELIYVGATRQFGAAGNRFHGGMMFDNEGHGHMGQDGHDEAGLYGQEGAVDNDFDYGDRTAVEIRISPEPFGVYVAIGALITEADRETVVWDERSRTVGTSSYVTGLTAEIEGKSSTLPAAGAGINHVFPGGLSLAAGFLVGLQKLDSPDVTVTATNPNVSETDLDRFRRKIRRDFNDIPFMVHLAIGYNF